MVQRSVLARMVFYWGESRLPEKLKLEAEVLSEFPCQDQPLLVLKMLVGY